MSSSSNLNYYWTGPNNFTSFDQDISNLFAGTYILNTTDSLGCALDTFIVEQPLSLASYLDYIIHNICWSKNEGVRLNIVPTIEMKNVFLKYIKFLENKGLHFKINTYKTFAW